MASFTQAWRALARRRTFTTVTLLTLALGIGLTTTTFSIVNGVLLRPLPFPDGDRLVSLYEAARYSTLRAVKLRRGAGAALDPCSARKRRPGSQN